MKEYFPFDPANPVLVNGERHTIVDGKVRLLHVPVQGSVFILGFNEVDSAANLQENEFFCHYSTETNYREADRLIWFNKNLSNREVIISYKAAASPVTADDMNEIKRHLDEADEFIADVKSTVNDLESATANFMHQVRTDLREHNTNPDAHADIRQRIADDNERNLLEHAKIRGDIIKLQQSFGQDVDEAIAQHNTDITAHQDIRKAIADEAKLRAKFQTDMVENFSLVNGRVTDEIQQRKFAEQEIWRAIEGLSSIDTDNIWAAIDELNEHADELDDRAAGLSLAIAGLCAATDTRFAGVEGVISAGFSYFDGQINGLSTALGGLSSLVGEVVYTLSAVAGGLTNEIVTRQAVNNVLIAQVGSLSTALATEYATRSAQINGLSSSLWNSIGGINGDIGSLWGSIGGINGNIGSLWGSLGGLSRGLQIETGGREADVDSIWSYINGMDQQLARAMLFGGSSSTFPDAPQIGEFAFMNGLPYVFDGNQWIMLKGGDDPEPTDDPAVTFLKLLFSNWPNDGYTSNGKVDFLTYVFGDATPAAYSEGGAITKQNFLTYVLEGGSLIVDPTATLDVQTFLDRMRDFRIALDKRYKFKTEDDDQPAYSPSAVILGFEPSTIEGAMWLTV